MENVEGNKEVDKQMKRRNFLKLLGVMPAIASIKLPHNKDLSIKESDLNNNIRYKKINLNKNSLVYVENFHKKRCGHIVFREDRGTYYLNESTKIEPQSMKMIGPFNHSLEMRVSRKYIKYCIIEWDKLKKEKEKQDFLRLPNYFD
jgi:hypothetical protein